MENDLKTIMIKIPSSVKPEIRKYQAYANTLRKYCLLYDDFMRYLNGWKFTPEMIRDLKSVMSEYPQYSLNEIQMEWLEEYRNSIVTTDRKKDLVDFLSKNGINDISDINDIIAKIGGIKKPKEIKRIFQNTDRLMKSGIYLKEFCDVVIKYLGKEGEGGWNYQNAKR